MTYNYLLNDNNVNYQIIKGQGNAYFICKDIYRGEKYNDTCLAELNLFVNKNWLFGEVGMILNIREKCDTLD